MRLQSLIKNICAFALHFTHRPCVNIFMANILIEKGNRIYLVKKSLNNNQQKSDDTSPSLTLSRYFCVRKVVDSNSATFFSVSSNLLLLNAFKDKYEMLRTTRSTQLKFTGRFQLTHDIHFISGTKLPVSLFRMPMVLIFPSKVSSSHLINCSGWV